MGTQELLEKYVGGSSHDSSTWYFKISYYVIFKYPLMSLETLLIILSYWLLAILD